jgi:hypothetical protein
MVSKDSQTNCILFSLHFLITLSTKNCTTPPPPQVNQSKESVSFRSGYLNSGVEIETTIKRSSSRMGRTDGLYIVNWWIFLKTDWFWKVEDAKPMEKRKERKLTNQLKRTEVFLLVQF